MVECRALGECRLGVGDGELATSQGSDMRLGICADLYYFVVPIDEIEEVGCLDSVIVVSGICKVVCR